MKNYTPEELKLFVIIADEISLSAAAARAELSNSALSKRLERLEEKTGRKLIHRPGKPTKLTAAGKIFLQMAENVLHEIEVAEAEMAALDTAKPLRLMVNPSVGASDLPDVIAAFKATHNVKIQLSSGDVHQIIKAIKKDEADLGLIPSHPNVEGLRYFPYRDDSLVLLVPLSHRFAQKKSIAFKDLDNIPLVGTSEARRLTNVLAAQAKIANITLNYEIETDSFELQAAVTGNIDCCALMLASIANHYKKTLLCKIIPISDAWAKKGTFYICTQDRGAISTPARDFMQILTRKYHHPSGG